MASKCQTCGNGGRDWMYHPFGPGEGAAFTVPGAQYRGFAALGICDECKNAIQAGHERYFTYKGTRYKVNDVWLSGLEDVYLVRPEGNLDPGCTHLLIDEGDPDWDVMMCGTSISDYEQIRLNRSGSFTLTVDDLCLDCLEGFTSQMRLQQEDKRLHRARPVGKSKAKRT